MGAKLLSQGASVAYKPSSVFVPVADAVDITYDSSRSDIDITTLANFGMQYKPGLVDGGTLSFTCRMDPTVYSDLYEVYLDGTIYPWEVTTPGEDGFGQEYSCYIQSIGYGASVNAPVDVSVTLKIDNVEPDA